MQLQAGRRLAMLVNGERTETGAASLGELVAQLGFSQDQVATARQRRLRAEVGACRHSARRGRQDRDCRPAPRRLSSSSGPKQGDERNRRALGSAKPLRLYGVEVRSRLLLGTARYPSPQVMSEAVKAARVGIVTVSVRREQARGNHGRAFFELIKALGVRVMPNTAGCRTPKEAIATAQMARELFGTDWVKLEVIGNDDTLQPDLFGLVEAAGSAGQRRLQGVSLHHRGPGCRRAPARGRLRGADALGRADRHRPWARQPLRLEVAAAVLPGRAAHHRRRHRRALACRRRHGDGLRCRAAEHRRGAGGRSGAHGPGIRGRDRGRPHRLRGGPDGNARHGGTLDAGRRHPVLRSGTA